MRVVNLARLNILYDRVQGSPYKLGAKWPLGADSSAVRGTPVDCSGFVRWILDRCGVRLPDGSQAQGLRLCQIQGGRGEVKTGVVSRTRNTYIRTVRGVYVATRTSSDE